MNKTVSILLLAIFLVFLPACLEISAEPEAVSKPPSTPSVSETVPKKPTAAEAAKHNEAIDPKSIRMIQFDEPSPGDETAVITTTEGDIKIRLFRSQAPETVSAFIKLAEEGYYNGCEFSEVVDGYKIDGAGKTGDKVFPDEEFSLDLWNFRGAVAVSNNGGNFMIVTANHCLNPKYELDELMFPEPVTQKYLEVGGAPHQDWKNTVFGQVIDGMDVAEKIAAQEEGWPAAIIEIKTGVKEEAAED